MTDAVGNPPDRRDIGRRGLAMQWEWMTMIDVIQALELLEGCAEEVASEDARGTSGSEYVSKRRMSLTARALAKRGLNIGHLARFSLRGHPRQTAFPNDTAMTLGAWIVFRTADRFGRAGASTSRTLDAVYHAVHRYAETIPSSLQDGADRAAIRMLIGHSAAAELLSSRADASLMWPRAEAGVCGGVLLDEHV